MTSSIENITPDVLRKFPPKFQPLLLELANFKYVSMCEQFGDIQIKNIGYSCIQAKIGDGKADRFVLILPYINSTMEWNVIFDSTHLALAPEFQFDDATFLSDPDLEVIEKHIPSWNKWNINNPCALKNIIGEFYEYYKKYQFTILENSADSRAHLEYMTLISEEETTSLDIGCLVHGNFVTFLIKLDITFPELPIYEFVDSSPGEDGAYLLVKFNKENAVDPKLYLSARIQQAIEPLDCLKIPHLPHTKVPLMDYIPTVKNWLVEKLTAVSTNYLKCQEFISTLLVMYQDDIIEYDAISFRKAHLLYYQESLILIINLDAKFPMVKPKVTMINLVNDEARKISDFPFSPRWAPEIMIEKLLDKLASDYKK